MRLFSIGQNSYRLLLIVAISMAESLPRCRSSLSHFIRVQEEEERDGGTAHALCSLLPQTDSKLSTLCRDTVGIKRNPFSLSLCICPGPLMEGRSSISHFECT